MFSAEEIIELEKKWFKYKIKQKSKLFFLLLLLVLVSSFVTYKIYFTQQIKPTTKTITKQDKKEVILEVNNSIKKLPMQEYNSTIVTKIQKTKKILEPKLLTESNNSKPYNFKLIKTKQENGLFSSNGFLTLNLPFQINKKTIVKEEEIVQPIREIQKNDTISLSKNKKPNISIDMKEVDTISYLKDKYYSTSSIVFALMLSEEYYYEKDYKNTLKWALTANDIDSQNTKSWYWFAKAKLKLNQKEDALRALKAYLANNNSKRLSTLLQKIELGDTDEQ